MGALNIQLKFIFFLFVLVFHSNTYSQCNYYEDFSNATGWSQMGTNVEIQNGKLAYINGSADNTQRRIFKNLDNPYTSEDCWQLTQEFLPVDVGQYEGHPYVGHFLFALTENEQNPLYDCPDADCTGFPPGVQDAIILDYSTIQPPDGNLFFKIVLKYNSIRYDSEELIYNTLGNVVYLELTKSCGQISLNIFQDVAKTISLGNGPVSLDIPALNDLHYIQHGNNVGGYFPRELSGELDNVCIESFEECGDSFEYLTYEGCEEDGYFMEINGTIYDENNPTGTEILENSVGCDSIVTVDLIFKPNSYSNVSYLGCESDGYFIEVNGTIYNENNPTGIEITNSENGCDSIIDVDLQFFPETYNEILYEGCENDGYQLIVNGTIYNEDNPWGTEILVNLNGCDSIVDIDMLFFENTFSNFSYEGCQNDGYFIEINGTIYDENNTTGIEVIENSNGCDSTITIVLIYNPISISDYSYEGCNGDGFEVFIGSTLYNQDNSSGIEYLQNEYGCDSIIYVNLTFNDNSESYITYNGCTGDGYEIEIEGVFYGEYNQFGEEYTTNQYGCDSTIFIDLSYNDHVESYIEYEGCIDDGYSIIVNNTIYNESNPYGEEHMFSQYFCDSIIYIHLYYNETSYTNINYEGCIGDDYEVEVNGVFYGEYNPIGTEFMTNQYSCDSIIFIDLTFNGQDEILRSYEGCEGDGYEEIINGIVYDELNSQGIEYLQNQFGCDSIITVDFNFSNTLYSNIDYIGCTGDGFEINVNGTLYNEINPSGEEVLVSTFGCDSIVLIDLIFYDNTENEINYFGCKGDGYEIEVNGTIYNEVNPTGVENLSNENGCELTISIYLVFHESSEEVIYYKGCEGDGYEIEVNNTIYNEENPEGTEYLMNQFGCDSIVNIDLTFNTNTTSEIYYEGCEGDGYEIEVNGTIYNEGKPMGSELSTNFLGCDSIIKVNLIFHEVSQTLIEYDGVKGDGYSIEINDIFYHEGNPKGIDSLKSIFGCDSIIIIDLIFKDDTSNDDTKHYDKICMIYPNPFDRKITIQFLSDAFFKDDYILTILTIEGKEVITNNLFHKLSKIDLGFLKAGIYLVRIQKRIDGKTNYYKIVKS